MPVKKRQRLHFERGKLVVKEEQNKASGKANSDTQSFIRGIGIATELGFVISFPIIGGIFLGVFLDKKFSSYPKLTLSLMILGVIIAFMNLFSVVREYTKKRNLK